MLDIKYDAAAEAVAVFRMQVLGGLPNRILAHGELRKELRRISEMSFLAPDSSSSKRISITTLERWYYAMRKFGASGLHPKVRADRGHAQKLTLEQKKLAVDIRCLHPHISATLILRTLKREGRIDAGAISETTLRRYFAEEGVQKTIASTTESVHSLVQKRSG